MTFAPAQLVSTLTTSALRSHLAQPASAITALHIGKSLIETWPAFTKWRLDDDLEGLRRAMMDGALQLPVDVEIGKRGKGYLDPDYQRVSMDFGLFLDAFILGKIPSSTPASALPTGYLAQSDVMDNPTLIADVPNLPQYEAGSQKSLYRRTIWVGPKRSFTPFHKDPYVGIYSQIIGHKRFHILPVAAVDLLEPSTKPQYQNTSTIPVSVSSIFASSTPSAADEVNFGKAVFPDDLPPRVLNHCRDQLTEANKIDGACQVDLAPGESVLVPEGWWHSAEGGDSPGVGVGAWFR